MEGNHPFNPACPLLWSSTGRRVQAEERSTTMAQKKAAPKKKPAKKPAKRACKPCKK